MENIFYLLELMNLQKIIKIESTKETQSQPVLFIETVDINSENGEKNSKELVTNKPDTGVILSTPANDSFKSYMDFRTIKDKTSDQYKYQQSTYTDKETGIRMYEGRYCVAVGSYYTTTIGTHMDIVLNTGIVIESVLADCKNDAHTEITNRQNPNGSVVEFVVDINYIPEYAKIKGDMSYANDEFLGEIDYIIVYKN